MKKQEFLKKHGGKRVKCLAGILHSYIKNETIKDHEELESLIRKNHHHEFERVVDRFENLLEF